MAKFRKKPPCVVLSGGDGFITRIVPHVDENLVEHQEIVSDVPKRFATRPIDPKLFDLKSKIDSGVSLKEENSVVFESDSLSESELQTIEKALTPENESKPKVE